MWISGLKMDWAENGWPRSDGALLRKMENGWPRTCRSNRRDGWPGTGLSSKAGENCSGADVIELRSQRLTGLYEIVKLRKEKSVDQLVTV